MPKCTRDGGGTRREFAGIGKRRKRGDCQGFPNEKRSREPHRHTLHSGSRRTRRYHRANTRTASRAPRPAGPTSLNRAEPSASWATYWATKKQRFFVQVWTNTPKNGLDSSEHYRKQISEACPSIIHLKHRGPDARKSIRAAMFHFTPVASLRDLLRRFPSPWFSSAFGPISNIPN